MREFNLALSFISQQRLPLFGTFVGLRGGGLTQRDRLSAEICIGSWSATTLISLEALNWQAKEYHMPLEYHWFCFWFPEMGKISQLA